MTPKYHPGGDQAATLHTLADTLRRRALAHARDSMLAGAAGDWPAADAALAAARADQAAADALADEAEQL